MAILFVEVDQPGGGLPLHPARGIVVKDQGAPEGDPARQLEGRSVEHEQVDAIGQRYFPRLWRLIAPPGRDVEVRASLRLLTDVAGAAVQESKTGPRPPERLCHIAQSAVSHRLILAPGKDQPEERPNAP